MEIKLQTIRLNRFVWHVTYKENRRSIGLNGLKTEFTYKGAVFANNQSESLFNMWPLPIDGWDPGFSVYDYDFWRIDTLKAGVTWYLDPFMEDDYKAYFFKPNEYWLFGRSILLEVFLQRFLSNNSHANIL